MTVADFPLQPVDWFPLRLHDDVDHHAGLALRRARTPVAPAAPFGTGEQVWVVYGYDDAAAVLTDDRFSLGVVEQRYGAVLGRSVLTVAPRARRALRRVVGTHLQPGSAGLEGLVAEVVAGRVEDVAAAGAAGAVDLAPLVAAQVPARVLARVLGVPEDEWPVLARLAAAAGGLLSDPRAALRAARALRRSLAARVAACRARPGGDLVSALAGLEVDGRPVDEDEVVASLLLLVWAGTETTFPAILGSLHALLTHPEAEAAVRADPGLVPAAVEEALRWETPVQVTSRTAEVPVAVGGTAIPAGATVLVHLGSANRDPRTFPDPDRYEPARGGRPGAVPHLAFGWGVHRCLGRRLAEAEITTSVAALLDRFPRLRLAPGAPPPEGQVLRSPRCLPVLLH